MTTNSYFLHGLETIVETLQVEFDVDKHSRKDKDDIDGDWYEICELDEDKNVYKQINNFENLYRQYRAVRLQPSKQSFHAHQEQLKDSRKQYEQIMRKTQSVTQRIRLIICNCN